MNDGYPIKRAKDGSDTLLMFLLRGHKPDKYKERREQTKILNNCTAQDRSDAVMFGIPIGEFLERKENGTLPPLPELPEIPRIN